MDSLKKPEMILSIVNLIGLVSIAVYGYKKSISTSEEIETLKKHLNEVIKRSVDFGTSIKKLDDLTELVKQLDQTIKSKDNRINSMSKSLESVSADVDDLMDAIAQIVKQLKDQGLTVKVSQPVEEEPLFGRSSGRSSGRQSGRQGGRQNTGRQGGRTGRYRASEETSEDRTNETDADLDDPDSQVNEFRRRRNGYNE